MDTDKLSSMYAQIVLGASKKDSRFVTDEESSKLWDQISEEVKEGKTKGYIFHSVNEIPDVPDTLNKVTPAEEEMKQLRDEMMENKDWPA